jgi:iron complex outermembrane receptor protein
VLNYYHRNSLFDRDRGFSNQAKPPSTSSSPFNLQLSREAVIAAGGTPPAGVDTFFGHAPFFSGGDAPAAAYTYSTGRTSFYNFEVDRGAVPDSERYGGFVNLEHRLFDDQMILYADTFYQNVKTLSTLAATPTGFFDQPGKTILAIPPHEPGPTLGGPTYEETGVSLGAFNPFNPFQQIISGTTRGRLAEFPPRTFDNETDAFFSTLGLKGDRLFDGTWGYDAALHFSEVKNTGEQTVVSATRFNRILNAADPIFDPASSQFIGTTVPYNPFGDYRVPIPANQLPINYATIHPKEIDTSRLATFDLNIYTTELCKLPAGGLGFAFGGQFRRESLRQAPDELAIEGDILGESAATFTNAGRKTYGIYAEGDLPVFSSTYNLPGFHALDFTASTRYEEFLSNKSNVLVPKFGLRWQPFDDSFTVRSTWGEGFHQPSLIELFGTPSQGLITVNDPATGTQVTEVPFLIRSNPNLQPEDSRAFTAGIVYSPKFASGLTLTVDLFNIESKGRVNSFPNPNDILFRALEGRSLFGEEVLRDEQGNLIAINGAYQNGGSQKARGADFGIQSQLETGFGTFTSLTQATYLDSFQFAGTPDVPEKEFVGTGDQFFSSEANLRWKGTSRLDWAWKNFDLVATVTYRDGFHEHQLNGLIHYVKQTWFFDGQASYDFRFVAPVETRAVAGYSKGEPSESAALETAAYSQPIWQRLLNRTSITIGCNDIFGQDPPRSFGEYPIFAYDPTGRFIYLSLKKRF